MKELQGWTCFNMINCKGDQLNQQSVACCTQSRRNKCQKEGVCDIVMPNCTEDEKRILKKLGTKMSERPYYPREFTIAANTKWHKALTKHLNRAKKEEELIKQYGAKYLKQCKAVIIRFGRKT